MAQWELRKGGFPGGSQPIGPLTILETVTDKNGMFHFSKWGPKYSSSGRMHNHDPQIILFKPYYKYKVLVNQWISSDLKDYQSVRKSDWNDKTISLERVSEITQKYGEHLYDLKTLLDNILQYRQDTENCFWTQTPKILVAIHKLSVELDARGIKMFGQKIFSIKDILSSKKCGNPEELLK